MTEDELLKQIMEMCEKYAELSGKENTMWRYKLAQKLGKKRPRKFHQFVKMLNEADVLRRGVDIGAFKKN